MSTESEIKLLKDAVLQQADFPTPGTLYRSFWPIWNKPKLRRLAIIGLLKAISSLSVKFDCIAALESRGYPIATSIMNATLDIDLIPICKPGKLPPPLVSKKFFIPYRNKTECLETRAEWIKPGARVLLVDDLLDSGASFLCAKDVIESVEGAKVVGAAALLELQGNGGREALAKVNVPVATLLQFKDNDVKKEKTTVSTEVKTAVSAEVTTDVQAKPLAPPPPNPFDKIPPEEDYRIVIIAHPSMKSTAEALVQYCPKHFRIAKTQWLHFKDGQPNMTFEALRTSHKDPNRVVESLCNRHVLVLLSLCDRAWFLDQAVMLRCLPRQDIKSCTAWIPYLAQATHDRVDVPGMVATAEPVAKLLSAGMPFTNTGPVNIVIVDIHALQEQFYFTDEVRPLLVSAIPTLIREIETYDTEESMVTIAFPDDGADKRFGKLFSAGGRPIIVCSKERIGDERKVRIKEFKNCKTEQDKKRALCRVLIVDDILHSGGTLVECAEAIQKEAKAYSLSCRVWVYITHGVFDQGNFIDFMPGGKRNLFQRVFTTNTVPEVASQLVGKEPFQVINVTSSLLMQKVLERTKPGCKVDDILPMLPRKVWLASQNKDKLKAVRMAYKSHRLFADMILNRDLDIQGIDIPDDPERKRPEQPIGVGQTIAAAEERMNVLVSRGSSWARETRSLLLSIESGLILSDPGLEDRAYIITQWSDDPSSRQTIWSEGVTIPHKSDFNVLDMILKSGQTKTAGQILKEKYGYDSSNWHVHYGTGASRAKLISNALAELLARMISLNVV